jgi:hypothetical protein
MRKLNGVLLIGGVAAVAAAYFLAKSLQRSEAGRKLALEQNDGLRRQLAGVQSRLTQAEIENRRLTERVEAKASRSA